MWRDAFQQSLGRTADRPRGVARIVGESEPMRDLKVGWKTGCRHEVGLVASERVGAVLTSWTAIPRPVAAEKNLLTSLTSTRLLG